MNNSQTAQHITLITLGLSMPLFISEDFLIYLNSLFKPSSFKSQICKGQVLQFLTLFFSRSLELYSSRENILRISLHNQPFEDFFNFILFASPHCVHYFLPTIRDHKKWIQININNSCGKPLWVLWDRHLLLVGDSLSPVQYEVEMSTMK